MRQSLFSNFWQLSTSEALKKMIKIYSGFVLGYLKKKIGNILDEAPVKLCPRIRYVCLNRTGNGRRGGGGRNPIFSQTFYNPNSFFPK
jgi:hypothetical protein